MRWRGLGFEWRVALRFLFEGRFQSLLIIVGVAAGVAVVAYISALVGGLQRNTLEKTLGAQPHVVISPPDEVVRPAWPAPPGVRPLTDTQARAQRLLSLGNWPAARAWLDTRPEIAAVSPLVAGAALAQRGEASRSVSVQGVELESYARIVNLRQRIAAGEMRLLPGEALIGQQLAADLGLRVGDRLVLNTGSRSDNVRISGLLDYGARELNRRTVLLPLRSAQSLLDLPGGATQIDLSLRDVWAAQELAQQLGRMLPYKVESWQETNAQLVSALNAQSVSTTLIRAVVMVVVVLGIASVLVVTVVQKRREIGILRAMGVTRAQIMRVFLVQGAVVAVLGSLLGVALAVAMVYLFTHFVRGSDGLPLFVIQLPASVALQVSGMALLAGVLAAWAPARRAAAMDPAQAIRL
ncbi:ABC transporter permease [Pelomonas sp. CA6]|uniref:ABC transporter permease n=1 Tax=Pelomonas sp. CA6 TaxID=2907999 RepID=UPI001F4BFA52|nr:FtsX-like permease family protein [Pelomonas sp. CA6]MCH7343795.1 ABC transporter permease [Pelomonas sp. CA6]